MDKRYYGKEFEIFVIAYLEYILRQVYDIFLNDIYPGPNKPNLLDFCDKEIEDSNWDEYIVVEWGMCLNDNDRRYPNPLLKNINTKKIYTETYNNIVRPELIKELNHKEKSF